MTEIFKRKVFVYGDDFWIFYNAQNEIVQKKIDWVIDLIKFLKVIPERFFKHVESEKGLYEIRIKLGSNIYRIFCFFDEGNLVLLLNGFQKKTQKAPIGEIERARKLKQEYYEDKQKK